MQVKQIIKISLIVGLCLTSYFLKGYPVEQRIFPLVLIYSVFLNYFDISENYKSGKNYQFYLLRGLNMTFLFLAICQAFFIVFSFEVMLGIVLSSALLSIALNARLSLSR